MPSISQAVSLVRTHFCNRLDLVAVRAPWGKPVPITLDPKIVKTAGTDPLDALVASHVLGRAADEVRIKYSKTPGSCEIFPGPHRIGVYAPAPDNTTRWVCLDFDGAGHSDALADPAAAAVDTLRRLQGAGINAYLERSGGGSGYHVWIFFAQPEPADRARELGHHFAPRDARLAGCGDGGEEFADPAAGRGIEVFPKQGAHRGKQKTGNLVWAPWWAGATTGGNVFYQAGDVAGASAAGAAGGAP